jgi:YbbR domain-containing protein
MIRFLQGLIVRNWGLKLLALVLAFLLWLALMPEEKIFSEKSLSVPLELRDLPPEFEIVEKPQASIEVTLRAPNRLLGVLAPSDIQAVLDLGRASINQEDYPLNPGMIAVPAGAKAVRVFPNKVRLKIEKSKEDMMQVQPAFVGKLKNGWTVEVNPSKVFVRGPESKFNARDRIRTGPIDVTNLARTAVFEVDLILPKPELRFTSPAAKAKVTVTIPEPAK